MARLVLRVAALPLALAACGRSELDMGGAGGALSPLDGGASSLLDGGAPPLDDGAATLEATAPSPGCGPSNCAGCCLGDGDRATCNPGVSPLLCGRGGERCSPCISGGKDWHCLPSPGGGGRCALPPPCGQNCAGCCVGVVCAYGTQDFACGRGGGGCVDCTASSQLCSAAGTCGLK